MASNQLGNRCPGLPCTGVRFRSSLDAVLTKDAALIRAIHPDLDVSMGHWICKKCYMFGYRAKLAGMLLSEVRRVPCMAFHLLTA
jgi:hypothetical protein